MHENTNARPASSTAAPELLGSYPHVAACPTCREYAASRITLIPATELIAAVLAHHDSSHRGDPLVLASQHFA